MLASVLAFSLLGLVSQAQAQVATTCSWVEKENPAANLHCAVYGTIKLLPTDTTRSIILNSLAACSSDCLDNGDCVSFAFNSTSSTCTAYGRNLVQMDLKQVITPGDTILYNHKCWTQQCIAESSTTASATNTLTTTDTTSSSTATITNTPDSSCFILDPCFKKFNQHPKTASSICGDLSTQTAAPAAFRKACAGDYASRASSICGCFSSMNTRFTPTPAVATSSAVSTTTEQSSMSTSATPTPLTSSDGLAETTLSTTSTLLLVSSSSSSSSPSSPSTLVELPSTSTTILYPTSMPVSTSSSATTSSSPTTTLSSESTTASTTDFSPSTSTHTTSMGAGPNGATITASVITTSTVLVSTSSHYANTTSMVTTNTSSIMTTPVLGSMTSVSSAVLNSSSLDTALYTNTTMFRDTSSTMTTPAPISITSATSVVSNSSSFTTALSSNTTGPRNTSAISTATSYVQTNLTSTTVDPLITPSPNSSIADSSNTTITSAADLTSPSSSLGTAFTTSTFVSNSSSIVLYPNTTTATTTMASSSTTFTILTSTSVCNGCTTSMIAAPTTASAISPSALPAASQKIMTSSAESTTTSAAYPAGPTLTGPTFYAQVLGSQSNQNGKYLVLASSNQGPQVQTDTAFVGDPNDATLFQLDSAGHLKVAGSNQDEAFNFFYDTPTAINEDYLVWDDPGEIATLDKSKPMYCNLTTSEELQCMNSHENLETFTTFFTCNEFAYLGMTTGTPAFPKGLTCTVVTIAISEVSSSTSPASSTAPAAPIPTCDDSVSGTFYLVANSTTTNPSNMNNNQYLVSMEGQGYGYNTGGVTYFTDDFRYATPFSILSSGDLVLADACNQDGYWDTYGDVLGFNIPNTENGYDFKTGQSATFFVSPEGTLESDVETGSSYYESQPGVFFVCDTSPKLRFDWKNYQNAQRESGCDLAVLEVIYAVQFPAQSASDPGEVMVY